MGDIPNPEDYTTVWICPLEVEHKAALRMLDRLHEGIPERSIGQNVLYNFGEIGPHKVAIVGYYEGEVGIGVSGSIVTEAMRDLQNLEFGLLVGIGGGIPSEDCDIRLGDVAVAVPKKNRPGIIAYEFSKEEDDKIELKQWPNSTHPMLRSAIRQLSMSDATNPGSFARHIPPDSAFKRPCTPPASSGLLAECTRRASRDPPKVHYGTMLSGDKVIKSQKRRDELSARYGAIAIEMEAAGMMTMLPVAVIRGIADYADSSKNDEWHEFAAISAAAYAKELLLKIPAVKKNRKRAQILSEECKFVGRKKELEQLEGWLGTHSRPWRKSVAALWGLGGAGKSQIAAELVNRLRSRDPDFRTFWINAQTQRDFENSVIKMLKGGDEPRMTKSALIMEDSPVGRTELVNSFFTGLNLLKHPRWLLVIDGVPAYTAPSESQGYQQDQAQVDVHSYVRNLTLGSILLTTRSSKTGEAYPNNIEITGLPEEDAVALLRQRGALKHEPYEDLSNLARILKGLPLALKLAAHVISHFSYTSAQYVKNWHIRGTDDENVTGTTALHRSFEMAFEELKRIDPIAAKILILFGFLDGKDLWYDICLTGDDDRHPTWLRDLARQKEPFRKYYPAMTDLSFVKVRHHPENKVSCDIHPAIHAFVRRMAGDKEAEYRSCAVTLVAGNIPRSHEPDSWRRARRLEPHADRCWEYIQNGLCDASIYIGDLASFGGLYRLVGRPDRAIELYTKIQQKLIPNDITPIRKKFMAENLSNLGLACTAQCNFDSAIAHFATSIRLAENVPGYDHDALETTYYNIGMALMLKGDLERAEFHLRRAERHFSKSSYSGPLPENDREYYQLLILNDIGEVLLRRGLVDQARAIFTNVLQRSGRNLSESHPHVLQVKLNLGRLYAMMNDFDRARGYLEVVIEKYTKWWGRRRPETMRAVEEEAIMYMRQEEYEKYRGRCTNGPFERAKDLFIEVLEVYRDTYGEDSSQVKRIQKYLDKVYIV